MYDCHRVVAGSAHAARSMRRINTNRFLYDTMFPHVQGRRTLDIGCGDGAYSAMSKDTVRVDRLKRFAPDVLLDLEGADLSYRENEFECVLMIEFLEHLTRARGEELLRQAKRISSGKVYVLTPLWRDSDLHQSGWSLEDFEGWTRIDFGNYFFGYWECTPGKGDSGPAQKRTQESSQSAEIRSPFGHKTPYDY